MKLEQLVNKNLHELNPTDLIIWRYICNNMKQCCHSSIYEVANACNVSRTTVLRFAKKLSLDGFSDLKMILKLEIGESEITPYADITRATIDLCKRVGEEVSKQDFSNANKLIYQAKRIFIYSSGYVQENVANEMMRLFISCNTLIYQVKGFSELEAICTNIEKNDLFIVISLSGESSHVVEVAKKLHIQNVTFISLTQLKSNTLATLSTEHIYITPVELPAAVNIKYESVLMFFLVAEIWFVSYSQYLVEQVSEED